MTSKMLSEGKFQLLEILHTEQLRGSLLGGVEPFRVCGLKALAKSYCLFTS